MNTKWETLCRQPLHLFRGATHVLRK
ncbi:hypothetical protein [uncultured Mucilaginibacter sp.]